MSHKNEEEGGAIALKRRKKRPVSVVAGQAIAAYGFGDGHPFGPDRHDAFLRGLKEVELDRDVKMKSPRHASVEEIALFHTPEHINLVQTLSKQGHGFLDMGDTPAYPGIFEAASAVVGATLEAAESVLSGEVRRGFVPIAGLHHAARDSTSGFCVFNDCGVLVEALRKRGIQRVAYVDIDAHHGDGVYYGFESDPDLLFADIHEDGRFLFPGTGHRYETGKGEAQGTKLNLPLPPGADDQAFHSAWREIEAYLNEEKPEFIIMQCGADSLAGDPLTHMRFSADAHAYAARSLCEMADRFCEGRILGVGGGGYNRRNLADAWSRVVGEFLDPS